MVFIFDELDKLDQERDPQARSALDDIIGNLKTLFTTSGISFIFVAGKDLYERWMEDVGRGDSIYESVFTYAKYLPALWNSVEDFCDPLLDPEMTGGQTADPKEYLAFKKFLAFKGRGIPRMIQRGFNEYVRWSDTRAWLTFSPEGARRFRFYAGLYDVLHDNEEQLFGNVRDAELPVASDQRRLAMHYLIDWVLQRGLTDFSLEDSILASRRLSRVIAPSETVAPEIINALLRILVAHEYIEEIPAANLSQVQIINQGALPSPRYRLLRRRLVEMGSISDIFDQEAQTILAEKKSPTIPSDRYQIVKEIAHGGMGAVYQAFDTRTGRIVAIKQVRADLGSAYRERFRREAEILARFRHPGIVRVLDMDLAGEHCYLVMEFVEGARLSDLITQKALGAAEILIIARELLEVVEYIHSQGVIWRDLKPSNIIVTPEGELRVLDFGVARLAEVMADLEITVVGTQIGTPSYMSPEQIGTGVVDARADLYSVGVLLYQMVTGRLPFQGEKITDLIRKVLSETPPLPSGCAEVPPGLEPIIVKCLEKDPAKRFQSAREILEALPKPEGPANLRPRYTIGRSPDNDVVLNEPGLSRYHAELVESGAGYAVQDLNTVNGTFVNGTRVEYPTGLSDSDEIRIGGSVLLYLSP